MNEDELLRATVRRALADAQDRAAGEGIDATDAAWAALESLGVTGLGATTGSLADALHVLTEVSAAPVATPYLESCLLAAWLAGEAGIGIPDGIVSVALDRPLDLVRDRDGTRVSGSLRGVRWLDRGRAMLVLAAGDNASWVVRLDPGALPQVRNLDADGVIRADVTVGTVAVPQDAIGRLTDDVAEALRWRRGLAAAAALVGAMDTAVRMAFEHSSSRVQFGRPIISFQAVRNALVVAAGEVHLARAATARAVEITAATARPDHLAVGAAVLRASDAAGEVARIAHQVHGAMGTTEEHPLWRLTMRLWVLRDTHANADAWAAALGRRFGEADDPWAYVTGTG